MPDNISRRVCARPFLDDDDLARLEGTTPAEIRRHRKSGDSRSGLVVRGRLAFPPEEVIGWIERRSADRRREAA